MQNVWATNDGEMGPTIGVHCELFGLKMIVKRVNILKGKEKFLRLKMMGKKGTNNGVNSKLFGLRMRGKWYEYWI